MKCTIRCLLVVFDSYLGLWYIKLRLIDRILIKDGPIYSWGSPAPPASVTYFQTKNDFPKTEHVVLAALALSWNRVSHIHACLFTNRRLSYRNNTSTWRLLCARQRPLLFITSVGASRQCLGSVFYLYLWCPAPFLD